MNNIRNLIADDSFAIGFQSMGQYRTALLKALDVTPLAPGVEEWEAQDPRCCDCGALWLDVPLRMDEGQTQRGNGNGGPATSKPPINPQPQGGRLVRKGQSWGGYQPRPQGGTIAPPPFEP